MDVLITYNTPVNRADQHYLAHAGVMQEVRDVGRACVELGYRFKVLGIGRNLSEELKRLADTSVDVVFNLCESIRESSKAQALFTGYLELLGMKFTGSDSIGIFNAVNKAVSYALLADGGLPVPTTWPLTAWEEVDIFPVLVKPVAEDGSIGIWQDSIANSPVELRGIFEGKADPAFWLIQQYLDGREFYVSILEDEPLRTLALAEAAFAEMPPGYRPILSYDAKWTEGSVEQKAYRRVCPAQIGQDEATRFEDLATRAFKIIGLRHYGRVDIRLDQAGQPYLIDVNANPDITKGQGFPFAAEVAGITYPELIDCLLKLALQDKKTGPWS
ncbi:MAG: ATP-grasp domain-containing protein [Limnochordia bacterium]|nr:ATP-grasp domain-containing protein [Limnochordia bacterium]MDD2630107.1 ATP-grasp domain-containing protein [Limnochordia bacterium]MDD4518884.1 ATP-grasp domain-containing protein [Limnochordia bacterium]